MDVNPKFFPVPEVYRPDGNQTAKAYLLSLKKRWLEFGIAALKEEIRKKKELKKGQSDDTVGELNSQIEAREKETREAEAELRLIGSTKQADQEKRKQILRINVTKWISELHRKAVEEAELAGKSAGAAREQHNKNNDRYREAEDDFEKALKDPSFTNEWK